MAKKVVEKLETNVIYCADNLDVMKNLPSKSIDLIYIDPPFFSNREYETIWGDKNDTASFIDRWKGGINHYTEWMRPRLDQMHRLLKDNGSFFCHLDWHAVHYIKIIIDEIFGYHNFQTDIVWKRTNSKGLAFKGFANNCDTILYYAKSKKYTWNPIYKELDEEYVKKFYRFIEPGTGRKYRLSDLTNPNRDRPNLTYEWNGHKRVWRWTKERMKKAEKDGIIHYSSTGLAAQKRYLDEMKGQPIDNLWDDIKPVQAQSKERVGYPTQKPVELLERIIKATSNEGDIIADFFCGCGTALVAAHNLNRRYIGVDNSPKASRVVRKRLKGIGVDIPELAVKTLTKNQILKLKPDEFEEYVVRCIGGEPNRVKVADGGIDGKLIEDGTPIQVKKSRNIGRPVLDSFYKHLKKNNRGIIIALSFGKGAYEEVAKLKREGYDVDLVTLEDILEMSLNKQVPKLQMARPTKDRMTTTRRKKSTK